MLKRSVIFIFIALLAAAVSPSASSNALGRKIDELKSLGHRFEPVNLFAADAQQAASRSGLQAVVSQGVVASVNAAQIESLLNQRVTQFSMPLPDGRKLDLVEVDYSRMRVEGPNGEDLSWTNTGRHYQGVVMGDPDSVAAVSFYRNLKTNAYEIAGVYQTTDGKHMIGLLSGVNPRNEHMIYAESAMLKRPAAVECALDARAETPRKRLPVSALGERSEVPLSLNPAPQAVPGVQAVPGACVRKHVEASYDVYQSKGANTTNYVTGFFNISKAVYDRESIPTRLHYLRVWTSPNPEMSVSGYQNIWNRFWNRMYSEGIQGDLAMLVGFHIDRGIAALTTICGPDYNQAGISPIRDYPAYPNYEWSAVTLPHEFGHLFGSPHTQACKWNGNNTALDGCVAPEGSCPRPSSTFGTIMSYCSNFPLSNGFGSQPGNLIRNSFNNATCLVSCDTTSCSYTISPTSASYAANASSGSVAVTASSGCSWTATSNASWLTITSGSSGSGSGNVGYSVAANTTSSPRTGTLTIAGRTFTVSQAAGGGGTGTALSNGVGVSASGSSGSQTLYYIDVPSGASNLVMALSGGSGDADMHTRFGSAPTLSTYECRPYASGNNETCNVASPSAGRYYILLHAYTAYSGATLRASYTTGPTSTLRVISPNGGEVWSRGSTRTISWDKGGAARVDVALYRGTTFVQWLTWSNSGTSYSWTIPTSLTTGSTYRIQLVDYDVRTRTDSSDGDFTIN